MMLHRCETWTVAREEHKYLKCSASGEWKR
jgi:hypothetical protein